MYKTPKTQKSVVAPLPLTQQQQQQQQPSFEHSQLLPTYNILVIGQTQSGKSTLIQAIKRYENPNYKPDIGKIGNGVKSCTKEVITESISTNLPEYHVVNSKTKEPIKILHYFDNLQEFVGRKVVLGLDIARTEPNKSRFQIFDTPGLDDTNGSDVSHIRKILEKIMEARKIHLVIIVANSQVHISEGYRKALLTYRNVLSKLEGVMVFLHTKVTNEQQSSKDITFEETMKERCNTVDEIMQRKVPHFLIDNNLNESRPAHNCFTYNRIREILELAAFNKPVQVTAMPLHKTEKMIEVDNTVVQNFREIFRAKDEACRALDITYRLRADIDNVQRSIEQMESFIRTHETDELVEIYFNHFNETWRFFYIRDTIVFECPPQPYPIDDRRVLPTAVNVLSEDGGIGHDNWMVRFKRKPFESGSYYVRLYTKKRHRFRREISICKTQLVVYESELARLREEREIRVQQLKAANNGTALEPSSQVVIDGLINSRMVYARIIDRVNTTTLSWEMYKALDDAKAYEGRLPECTSKVQEFYSTIITNM
ncbi:hypothetical protein BGX26_001512 [Mortierella sp. AD094]|nr:hypothetical protein BGX26_001512 [Mortierella sp. AD094]